MKILFISTMSSDPWGGSEELWSQASLKLKAEGHHVIASVTWWPTPPSQILALESKGLEISRHRLTHQYGAIIRLWHKLRRRLPIAEINARWLRKQKPDLVVISQGANIDGMDWMELCQEQSISFVTVVHCNYEGWWPRDSLVPALVKAYSAAKQIYCVSKHNLDLLENQLGQGLPHAEVIWSPFNVTVKEPPLWPRDNGHWRIASVARLDPVSKGQDVLLKVLSLDKWRFRPLEVSFFGGGPCQKSLQRMAQKLGLANAHFRGHVEDIRAIWEQHHMLVLASRYEGLPLSLLEAMACARPAVVTDVGGNAEMCIDGETGFVAAAPAMENLDDALERAWAKRDEWQQMGVRSHLRARDLIPRDPTNDFCRKITSLER